MTDYTLQEQQFILLHRQLHAVAHEAAQAEIRLMGAYIESHHPGVLYEISIENHNVLSIEVVFPGLGAQASRQLSQELRDYLQQLLDSGREP